MHNPRYLLKTRGFTLIELVVCIAVIGVLSGIGLGAYSSVMSSAHKTKCLSNQRQIGMALLQYSNDNGGEFPMTTHTTGSFRKDKSWIFQIREYLDNVDEVRVCPAEPPARQKQILARNATSYLLNDLVFDNYEYNSVLKIPFPSRTLLLCVLNEERAPSTTRDHIHGGEWNTWGAALNDLEPDRHRSGKRAADRLKGSSNYLYADGHVRNIAAAEFKGFFDEGINPAEVPLH